MPTDYQQNPTLVKVLSASIAACLQVIVARSTKTEPLVAGAAAAALSAATTIVSTSGGEESRLAQAGLVAHGLTVLRHSKSGAQLVSEDHTYVE